MLKLTATALRIAFQLSSAADVSRLASPWGVHICGRRDTHRALVSQSF
jgi:hypothetical protein